MKAKGVEFSIGMNRKAGNFSYYVNANMGYGVANHITRDENITYPWQQSVGLQCQQGGFPRYNGGTPRTQGRCRCVPRQKPQLQNITVTRRSLGS